MGSGASSINPSDFTESDFAAIKAEYEKLKESGVAEEEIGVSMAALIESLKKTEEKPPVEAVVESAPAEGTEPVVPIVIPSDISDKHALKLLNVDQHKVKGTNESCISACTSVSVEMKITDVVPTPISIDNAVVSVANNFDPLLIPAQHMMRHPADSYFLEGTEKMLRTNLLAHASESIKAGVVCGVISGDVYRRIEEDQHTSEMMNEATYFVIIPKSDAEAAVIDYQTFGKNIVTCMLAKTIEGGDTSNLKFRWEEEAEDMPFVKEEIVHELQIQHKDAPLGIATGGIFSDEYLASIGCEGKSGCFITFSLDRLAMIAFGVGEISEMQKPC